MKRIFNLLLIAIATYLIIYFIHKPEVIKNIWLWIIGLAGPIAQIGINIFHFLKKQFINNDSNQNN